MDLVSAAFEDFQDMPHFVPTGELRSDLLGELESFSHAMVEYHLNRALAMLAEKAQTSHDVVGIRDSFVTAGEKPMRQTLEHADSLTAEAITMMLCGMVTHSVLMHGQPPQHEVLTKAVDLLLAGTDLS
jgi:hypothetical protein